MAHQFSVGDAVTIHDGQRKIPVRLASGQIISVDVPDGTLGEVSAVLPAGLIYAVSFEVEPAPRATDTGHALFTESQLRRV